MSAYIKRLGAIVASAPATSAEAPLARRITALVGAATITHVESLRQALNADPRAIGAALRELGFRRERIWSGDEYALTRWRRESSALVRNDHTERAPINGNIFDEAHHF